MMDFFEQADFEELLRKRGWAVHPETGVVVYRPPFVPGELMDDIGLAGEEWPAAPDQR
jgi:hypothetical protein